MTDRMWGPPPSCLITGVRRKGDQGQRTPSPPHTPLTRPLTSHFLPLPTYFFRRPSVTYQSFSSYWGRNWRTPSVIATSLSYRVLQMSHRVIRARCTKANIPFRYSRRPSCISPNSCQFIILSYATGSSVTVLTAVKCCCSAMGQLNRQQDLIQRHCRSCSRLKRTTVTPTLQ